MIHKLDSSFLKIFQKISDWSQITFGITNFALAKFFLVITVFSISSENVQRFILEGVNTWDIISTVLYTLIGIYFYHSLSKREEWYKNNSNFVNDYLLSFSTFRKVQLIFLPLSILSSPEVLQSAKSQHELLMKIFSHMYFISNFLYSYFASCTPKPPSESKARKFIEKTAQLFASKKLARA